MYGWDLDLVSLSYGWLGIYSDTGLIELKGTIFAFGRGMRSTECHLGYHVFFEWQFLQIWVSVHFQAYSAAVGRSKEKKNNNKSKNKS